MPEGMASRYKHGDEAITQENEDVTVIFADIVTVNSTTQLTTGTGIANLSLNGFNSIKLDDTTAYPGGYYPMVIQKATKRPPISSSWRLAASSRCGDSPMARTPWSVQSPNAM